MRILNGRLLFIIAIVWLGAGLCAEEKSKEVVLVERLKAGTVDERLAAAIELGQLDSLNAVPTLIEALRDREDRVKIRAHAALNAITGLNLGYKNYDDWRSAWVVRREEVNKYRETRKALRELPVEHNVVAKTLNVTENSEKRADENPAGACVIRIPSNDQAFSVEKQDMQKQADSKDNTDGVPAKAVVKPVPAVVAKETVKAPVAPDEPQK